MQSSEISIKSAEAYVAGKVAEGCSWQNVSSALRRAGDQTGKAFEAESAGKTELAALWREAVEQNRKANELYTQAAGAHTEGKTSEGSSLDVMGKSAYDRADALAKQAEALRLNPEVKKAATETNSSPSAVVLQSSEIAKEKETAAPVIPFSATDVKQKNESVLENKKAVEKAIEDKTGNSLFSLSPFIPKTWYDEQIERAEKTEQEVGEKFAKASMELEAAQKVWSELDAQIHEEENSPRAKVQIPAAKKQFQENLQKLQAARESAHQELQKCQKEINSQQPFVTSASEAMQKVKGAKEVAIATTHTHLHQVGKQLAEQIEIDQKEYGRGQRVLDATTKIDQERAEKTKSVQEEAAILERSEKIKAAREKALTSTGDSLKYQKSIINSLEKAAHYGSIAVEFPGNATLAEKYRQAMERSEKAAEQFTHAEDRDSWYEAGQCTQCSADFMIKASELLAAEDNALAEKYSEVSEKHQLAAEQFAQAIKAFEDDKYSYEEAEALKSTAWSSRMLASSMEYRLKVANALKHNKKSLVAEYTTASEKMDKAAECFQQSATACAVNKDDEHVNWKLAGQAYTCEIEKLEKAIEAEANGESKIAQSWREAAKQNQLSSDFYPKAATTHAVGKKDEGNCWFNVACAYQIVADQFGKAIEAEINKKSEVAQAWREAVKYRQLSVEPYTKAATAYALGKEDEADRWKNAGSHYSQGADSLEKVAEQLEKAIEAEASGKSEVAQAWREAAKCSQLVVEPQTKAAKAYASGKEDEGSSWYDVSLSYSRAVYRLERAIKAEASGKSEVAQAWREAVKHSQLSAEPYTKASIAYAAGKKDEAICWSNAGINYYYGVNNSLDKVAEQLEKAIEAEANGKSEIAQAWREAVKQNELSLEFYTKAAIAHAAGKKDEAVSWNNAGNVYGHAAAKLEKAIEVEANGKPETAQAWRETAKQYELSSECFTKAGIAHAAGKKDEGTCWNSAGIGYYYAAEKLGKAIEAEGSGKPEIAQAWREVAKQHQLSGESYSKAAPLKYSWAANPGYGWYHAGIVYSSAAKQLEKAIEAEASGKAEIAQAWREAAKQNQLAGEPFNNSSVAFSAGTSSEGYRCDHIASGYSGAAGKLEKAIEAEISGKPEAAQAWREQAKLHQLSAEHYTQAAVAHAAKKTDEGNSWDKAGEAYKDAAEKLEKAIEAEASGKSEVTQAWREAAKQYQLASEHYSKGAMEYAAGKTKEGKNWVEAGSSYRGAGLGYSCAADKLAEAIKAGKPEVAQAWLEAANQNKLSVEPYTKSAIAHIAGKTKEGESWNKVGSGHYWVAARIEKTIKAEASGNQEIAQAWREAVKDIQLSCDSYSKAAMAYAERKVVEGILWDKAGSSYICNKDGIGYVLVNNLEKIIEAEKSKKPESAFLAQAWREAFREYQHSNEYNIQAAVAYTEGKTQEGDGLDITAKGAYKRAELLKKQVETLTSNPEALKKAQAEAVETQRKVATYQAKAVEAEGGGKQPLAASYRNLAKTTEQAANQKKLSGGTDAIGKENEEDSRQREATSLQSSANYQLKAIEAEEVGKTSLAAGYKEVAAISQHAVGLYQQSVLAYASTFYSNEGTGWRRAGNSLQSSADYRAKALEAEEAGKIKLAAAYREAAENSQIAGDRYQRSVQEHIAKKSLEGATWDSDAASLQAKTNYQIKTIEAEEAGKATLAAGYREAVATSQKAIDQCQRALQAIAAGKTTDASSLNSSGWYFKFGADYQAKAIEAEDAGKGTLAADYRVVTEKYKKAGQAYAVGKSTEGSTWQKKAETSAKEADAKAKVEEGKATKMFGKESGDY